MTLSIQIAKVNIRQHQLRAVLPNLMLAKLNSVIYEVVPRKFKASMEPFCDLKISSNLRAYPTNTLEAACYVL